MPPALAQSPCAGGAATDGVFTFECSGVDLGARLAAQDMGIWPEPECSGCIQDVWGWTDPETSRECALVAGGRPAVYVVGAGWPTGLVLLRAETAAGSVTPRLTSVR